MLPANDPTHARTSGSAFGLDLVAAFPFPGLQPARGSPGRRVALVRVSRREVSERWPAETEILADHRRSDGTPVFRVEAHPAMGHRITAIGWGRYVVSADAATVRCAPVSAATWRWQRFLVGQVLPFVSILHGFEVFHASAVSYRGRVAAFAGRSTAGKTSIALGLLKRGGRLLADDVSAVGLSEGALAIHPGPGLLSIRHDAASRYGRQGIERLGRVIGRDDEAIRVVVPGATQPEPLTHLFILDRDDRGAEPRVQRLRPVDPRVLLASTFNLIVRTPDRLVRQLDVCARIAGEIPVFRVRITEEGGPDATSEVLSRMMGGPNIGGATS